MLARNLVEEIADDLGTIPDFVEKDWYIVRALGVVASLETNAKPVFSGGTQERKQRSAFREEVLSSLGASDFGLISVKKGNESRFFSADLAYQVRQAPKIVKIAPGAPTDPCWPSPSTKINAFLQQVTNGTPPSPGGYGYFHLTITPFHLTII